MSQLDELLQFSFLEILGWNRLELHPSEIQSVLVDREV